MTDSSTSLNACYQRIYAIVQEIPFGKVMTYGQIAEMLTEFHLAAPAVQVGRAMAAGERSAPDIPWWRVIGKEGRYGVLRVRHGATTQRALLAREGIHPDEEGRYDLARHQYTG